MSRARALVADTTGATVVEFALIAPVLLVTLLGMFDLGYTMYVDAVLQGEIDQTGRSSTIEGAAGSTAALDARMTTAIRRVVPQATIGFKRKSYASFSDVGRPEDFTDLNGNTVCDSGEPFEDANGNNVWDTDRGRNGQGGARDAVLYEVTVQYPRPFAMMKLAGLSTTVTVKAQTVLRNQPYNIQTVATVARNC